MKQVRKGVFETNSSSTHSLIIVPEKRFDKWEDGEIYLDRFDNELKTFEEKMKNLKENHGDIYKTEQRRKEIAEEELKEADEFFDDGYLYKFAKTFTTPSGDEMVAFGEYGRNG